jgi:hypothetical protein
MSDREEFEKWYPTCQAQPDFKSVALDAWQAATEKSSARIAELELKLCNRYIPDERDATIEKLRKDVAGVRLAIESVQRYRVTTEKYKLESLNLRVARLVDALQAMVNSAADNHCGLKIADDALSSKLRNPSPKES